jgi:hypothetical protein
MRSFADDIRKDLSMEKQWLTLIIPKCQEPVKTKE